MLLSSDNPIDSSTGVVVDVPLDAAGSQRPPPVRDVLKRTAGVRDA